MDERRSTTSNGAMRLRSMLLVLVGCAAIGAAIGGWAYANRTPRLILCAGSGPIGETPQQIAEAETATERSRAACQATGDQLNAEATRFDPVGFGVWAGSGAGILLVIGWLGTIAFIEGRPRQSLRGRDW